jgi:hypothetical protein
MANRYIKTGKEIECKQCFVLFYVAPYLLKSGERKFCSRECSSKGKIMKNLFQKGHKDLVPQSARGHSEETREKMKVANSAKSWKTTGSRNYRWIADRTKVKLDTERGGPLHKQWSRSVKNRDGWICKISNGDCSGQVVAHHILSWREYEELRYEVNNGITLCHFHHPRKRNDEMILSPFFQELVGVKVN